MKIRFGFVTNSSSTNFLITNTSDTNKDLVDFVKENPQLLDMYKGRYTFCIGEREITQDTLIQSAKENNETFGSNCTVMCTFGDEDGTLIGEVFDYILRDGGKSKSFTWRLHSYNR